MFNDHNNLIEQLMMAHKNDIDLLQDKEASKLNDFRISFKDA